MALNALGLGIVFTAKDLASGVMSKVSSSFKGLHDKGSAAGKGMDAAFTSFKTGLAIMGGGLATLGGAFALADAYGSLDDALDDVARTTRLTADELDDLEQAAFKAGLSTKFKPEEAVKGLGQMAKAFGSATDAAEQGIHVFNLASAANISVADAAKLTTQTLKLYGKGAADTQQVVDTFAKAQQVTSLNAKDFQTVFKRSAITGQQFNQSMEETILGLGLMKSRGLEGRQALTAYKTTLQTLGQDKKAQAALDAKGIAVTDKATGKMRAATVIIADIVEATKGMTEADKKDFIQKTLGKQGMTAYDSVAKATFKTMVDGKTVTLKGAEAVDAMGKAMEDAKGAAEKLTDALLDDFGGQQELIGSALDTIKKMVGKEFATALKPVAAFVLSIFRRIGQAILDTPAPIKQFIAKLVLLGGAAATVFGAFMAGTSAIAILVLGIKLIGATLLGVMATILPFIALFGVAVAVVAGFKYAVDHNIGGIGDLFHKVVQKVRLAFDALSQLFTQGGFSGAVRDEMRKGENQGIRAFAISVFLWVNRIKNFFSGIGTGFSAAMEAARPAFTAFVAALERLGAMFGMVQQGPEEAGAAYDAWGQKGQKVGEVIGSIMEFVVNVMTAVVDIISGVVEGFRFMGPVVDSIGPVFSGLAEAVGEVIAAIVGSDSATGESASGWKIFGDVIGGVAGFVVGIISNMVTQVSAALSIIAGVIGAVKAAIMGIVNTLTGVVDVIVALLQGDWAGAWESAKGVVFSIAEGIIGIVSELVIGIAGAVDKIGKLFGKDLGAKSFMQGVKNDLMKDLRDSLATQEQKDKAARAATEGETKRKTIAAAEGKGPAPGFIGPPPPPGFGAAPTVANAPGVVPTAAPGKGGASPAEVSAAATSAATTAAVSAVARMPPGVINATMTCDGEVLGKIAMQHQKGAANASGDVGVGISE